MKTSIFLCRKVYDGLITNLSFNQILVYGANPEGIHGAGVAKLAVDKYGAEYGRVGLVGQSYGLVTKNLTAGYMDVYGKVYEKAGERSISEEDMVDNIRKLYETANDMEGLDFLVAFMKSGKNLNGYSDKEMAKFFSSTGIPMPPNVIFEKEFLTLILERIIL